MYDMSIIHSSVLMLILTVLSCTKPQSNLTQTPEIQKVNPAEFEQLLSAPNTIVLDVRRPEEIAQGKIDGAVALDYTADDFKDRIAILDKTKKYLVYCRSGGRSAKSCDVMKDEGFTQLIDLKGGYLGWSDYQATKK